MIRFEWNLEKAAANKKRHGVALEEAQTVFYDETAVHYDDPDHSETEQRFLMLGLSAKLRVLIVSHTFRDADGVIRIISARKATKREESTYWRKRR
jgi:uncharacterized DUF497 family protein